MSNNTPFSPEMEMFRSDAFLTVNKNSIKMFGLINAVYLANLIDKDVYFRENHDSAEEFFLVESQQIEQLGLSNFQIRKARKYFIDNGILSVRRKNIPSKYFYTISYGCLSLVVKKLQHCRLKNYNTGDVKITTLYKDNKVKENKKRNNIFITIKKFETFWKLYPKKSAKGEALKAWKILCNKKDAKPTWKEIKRALTSHTKTKQWQSSKKHIPNASTWLNQNRWLNSAAEIDERWQQVQDINNKKNSGSNRVPVKRSQTFAETHPPDEIVN